MKTIVSADLIPTQSLAMNSPILSSVIIFSRHGARAPLRRWSEAVDFELSVPFSNLSTAGFSQAIQTGSRYYYKYRDTFHGELFTKSNILKSSSSDISRCLDTNEAFMHGWNTVAGSENTEFTLNNHFSDEALAPRASREALQKFIVQDPDLLRGKSHIISWLLSLPNEHYDLWHLKDENAEIVKKLYDASRFSRSATCKSDNVTCDFSHFNLFYAADFASTLISLDYHGIKSLSIDQTLMNDVHWRAAVSRVQADDVRLKFKGASASYFFSKIINSLKVMAKNSQPTLHLMTSHDTFVSSVLQGWGLEEHSGIFYNDSIAIEVWLPSQQTLEGGCMRLLYNGIQYLKTSKFPSSKTSGCDADKGFKDLMSVINYTTKVLEITEKAYNNRNPQLLLNNLSQTMNFFNNDAMAEEIRI